MLAGVTRTRPAPRGTPFSRIGGQVVVLGLCILSAYLIRRNRFYYLPESAAAILVGVVVGGMAKLFYPTKDELDFLSFNSVSGARLPCGQPLSSPWCCVAHPVAAPLVRQEASAAPVGWV